MTGVPSPHGNIYIAFITTAIPGQAESNVDYESLKLTLEFRPSDFTPDGTEFTARKEVTLPIVDDALEEPDETMLVQMQWSPSTPRVVALSNPDGTACPPNRNGVPSCTATVTIVDNDTREAPPSRPQPPSPPPATAPVFTEGAATTRSVAENTAEGTAIGLPVAASDSNDDMLTYTLSGADAEYFDIIESTGQIEVGDGTMLDHEARSGYTVEVTASNDSGATAMITVAVMVTNVDEKGTLTLSPVRPSVDTPVSAALSDPDGDVSGVTWRVGPRQRDGRGL